MKHYNKKEKFLMIRMYESYKSYFVVAKYFGCAYSTVYYTVNPEKYERHKEHVRYMSERGNQK